MHSDFERARDEYLISCDTSKLDLAVVHDFLSTSYWSLGLPHEVMHRAIEGSLCFGLYRGDFQVGFARVITDKATFAYLCDVFVLEAYRGKGLGRFVLVTRDAHGLYEQFGFQPLARPEGYLEVFRPDIYSVP
jgi:GNAT superfamily N-acetyltransferase